MNSRNKLYVASTPPSQRETGGDKSETRLRLAYDRSAEALDLTGTVNHYGPPQSIAAALGTASTSILQMSACEAAALVRHAYGEALHVPAGELLAFRGIGDFVGAISSSVARDRVRIPQPAPSCWLNAFPGRQLRRSMPSLELINDAMEDAEVVVITNPDQLVGVHTDPSSLLEIALAHPDSTLVVDETLIEFLADPDRESLIGSTADNIVVLRTICDFFGTPSTPVAVAWCADHRRLAELTGRDGSDAERGMEAVGAGRQIGGVEALATAAALSSTGWAERSKLWLTYDALCLTQTLKALPGRVVQRDVGVHFRTVLTKYAHQIARVFQEHGIRVLPLGGRDHEGPRGVRILAPSFEGQPLIEAAVAQVQEAFERGAWKGPYADRAATPGPEGEPSDLRSGA